MLHFQKGKEAPFLKIHELSQQQFLETLAEEHISSSQQATETKLQKLKGALTGTRTEISTQTKLA